MKQIPSCMPCLWLAAAILLLYQCSKPAPTVSFFDTLYGDSPIHLTVEMDINAVTQGKDSATYQPAIIAFQKKDAAAMHFEGKVKPRGVFRKQLCDFPPLKLKLAKKDLKARSLKTYNTFKIVTHCQEDFSFEQLTLKEFLAFRLYNTLTDRSFRAQLANIRYVDSQKKLPDIERYGFLIEDDEELADRLVGQVLAEESGALKTIDKEQYKVFTLFQYMIGNTDWSLDNRHNAVLIQPKGIETSIPFPVPYDFDFSGMVNAPYAKPSGHLPIQHVKERFFQWRGGQKEDFSKTLVLFSTKKAEIMASCQKFELLNEESKAEVLTYLGSFFAMLDSPGQIIGK